MLPLNGRAEDVMQQLASAALRHRPRRVHEAVLDREPVAARDDALLIVGIDARVNEERARAGVQQSPQFVGARQVGDGFDAQPAGANRALNLVEDYATSNVSEKVVRIILSYTDYINRLVWKKAK